MKVYDLTYVEDEVIAGLEKYLPQARDLMAAIHNKEQGAAAAAAAKEEERAASAKPKASTRPVSPNLSKQRLPRLPEPEKIEQNVRSFILKFPRILYHIFMLLQVTARPVPSYLDVTSLATIEQQRREKAEQVRQDTYAKYQDPELQFKFNETKGVRPIEEAKREVEQEFAKQLAFDSSFVNPVPDFNKKEAKVKLNTAAILREDALYKKQQEKDYNLLKNYEVELRDATEYYGWQREMKHRDHEVKLQQVVMRRELSRQSAVDAKDAVDRQKDHNRRVADMLREQAEAIVRQKEMQDEVRRLENQGQVAEIIAVREVAPKVAREKVEAERIEAGKRLREQLEEERLRKEEEDRLEEEARADRIMQLRALNTVHKKHIVVFDPTETSGVGLMGEMSYMEMKERMEMVRLREESREFEKRKDIVSTKEQKAKEMESKLSLINKYRKIKADSNREASRRRKEQEIAEKAAVEAKREVAAIHLDKELAEKREEKKRIALELAEEEERIKRQQQYLGAAKGAVDELIARQLLDGQERQIRVRQHSAKEVAEADEIAKEKDRVNREKAKRKEFVARLRDAERVETEVRSDKRDALEKQKLEMFRKKNMVKIGHEQTEKTREVVTNHNLYAKKISDDAYLRRTNAAAKTSNP